MIVCKCINKNRDSKGNIINYTLVDKNGKKVQLTGKQVKEAIKAGQFKITNLQIDSLGRLVDRAEATNKPANKLKYPKYILKEQYRTGKPQSLIGRELRLNGKYFATISGDTKVKLCSVGREYDISEFIARRNVNINDLTIFLAPFLEGYEIMKSNNPNKEFDEALKKFDYILKACNEHTDYVVSYFNVAEFLVKNKDMKPNEKYNPYDTPYIRATFEFTEHSFKVTCGNNGIEIYIDTEKFKLPYIKVALRILGYKANFKNASDIVPTSPSATDEEKQEAMETFKKCFPDKQYKADIVPYGVIENFGKVAPIENSTDIDNFCLNVVKHIHKKSKGSKDAAIHLDFTKITNKECPNNNYFAEEFVPEANSIGLDFWWATIADDYENTKCMTSERNWKADGYVKAFRFYFYILNYIRELLLEVNVDCEHSENLYLLPDYSLEDTFESFASCDGGVYTIVD